MIVLQLLIYCLLFTAMVKIAVIGGAVNGLYFYPKEVQDRAIELGLIDRNTMNRKRKCFMIPFFIVMLAALVLIIGLWNGASSFGEAYWQALLFLEVMNIYDGVVIDKLWVTRFPENDSLSFLVILFASCWRNHNRICCKNQSF